jgi:hypothetical protein
MSRLKILVPFLPLIVPAAARWVGSQETALCAAGEILTQEQISDAREVDVLRPENIRLKFVDSIPVPGDGFLRRLGKITGLLRGETAGITLRYGIYIRKEYRGDRELYVHEFVHVAQYERFGSIDAFLRDYLKECLDPGYPWGPLEQEAIHGASRVVRGE